MEIKKILHLSFLFVVLFGFTSLAVASVTISGTSIIGTVGSTIDIGAGNTLLMQTLNNGPVTIGSGLVTLGGNLTVTGLGGGGVKCLHVSNTVAITTAAADCGSGGSGTPGGSDGQVQVNSSGSFAGQASIFSGGTKVQRAIECSTGTVSHTALTTAAASQEITIQTAMSGDVRYDSIVLSETTQFAGDTGLTVSMGRPGSTTHAEMTNGINFPLQVSAGDFNFLETRPIPPQITSTYNLVLNFAVTSGNVNTASAGVLTWEVCGHSAR